MKTHFETKVCIEKSGEEHTIKCKIPVKEWELLLEFAEEVASLQSILKKCENINVDFSINWSQGETKLISNQSINENDISSILHRIRPFFLEKERFHLIKIVNLINKNLRSDLVNPYFKSLKDRFNLQDLQREMQMSVFLAGKTEELIKYNEILMKWLNAYQYHRDTEKQKSIKKVKEAMPVDFFDPLMQFLVVEKIKAVIDVWRIIQALKNNSEPNPSQADQTKTKNDPNQLGC